MKNLTFPIVLCLFLLIGVQNLHLTTEKSQEAQISDAKPQSEPTPQPKPITTHEPSKQDEKEKNTKDSEVNDQQLKNTEDKKTEKAQQEDDKETESKSEKEDTSKPVQKKPEQTEKQEEQEEKEQEQGEAVEGRGNWTEQDEAEFQEWVDQLQPVTLPSLQDAFDRQVKEEKAKRMAANDK